MSSQSLTNHLLEIRKRLIYSIFFFLAAFAVSYLLVEEIYAFLLNPLAEIYGNEHGKRIIFTGLAEAFITYVKLAFLSALFFSTPFFIIQLYLFIAPALYQKEKKFAILILLACPILFIIGTALLYFFILPVAFKFFVSFEVSNLTSQIPIELEAKISEYLSLVVKLIFGFGIAFQLPVITIILVKIGAIEVESLKSKRKYWILLIFILAAVLTPPDIFSQIFLAIPMILLYEISILICSSNSNFKQKTIKNAKRAK